MKTPKEKAEELVLKYLRLQEKESTNWFHKGLAKQCALIAVDEIIECTPSVDMYPPNFQSIHSRVREYWQEVRQEIELL